MPTSVISWNEDNPADGAQMGQGDDDLRSLKTALRTGLSQEHSWPAAGGATGAHLLGAARAFFAPQSLVSSLGTEGYLFIASNSSFLLHVGSSGTLFLGSSRMLSLGSSPTGGQRFHWVQDIGIETLGDAS